MRLLAASAILGGFLAVAQVHEDIVYANGDSYSGYVVNSMQGASTRTGSGTYIWKQAGRKYQGSWKGGKRSF